MGDATAIQWTDATWNPVRGCSRVSAGCENCYAETIAARFSGPGQPYEGLATRVNGHPRWTNTVRLVPEHLEDPLRWKRPRRIFVNSMSDLFHEDVPDSFLREVFSVMQRAHHHTFQVLTKRPERMRSFVRDWLRLTERDAMPPNIWLGITVEDQAAAEARIPLLLATPAAVRFLSCEPLLEAVYLPDAAPLSGIHWIIAGGESGPHARRCPQVYIESLISQARENGIPCFVKQFGSVWAKEQGWRHSHGGDPAEWPEYLRVREFPS